VEWIILVQYRVQRQVLTNTAVNLRLPEKDLATNSTTTGSSKTHSAEWSWFVTP